MNQRKINHKLTLLSILILLSSCVASNNFATPEVTPFKKVRFSTGIGYTPINGKYYENSMFSGGREFDYVIDSYSQLRYGFVKNWDIGVQASILGGISGDFGYQVSNKTIQSAFYLGFGLNQKEVLKDINTKEGFSTSMYAIYSFDTSNYLLLQ